MSLPANFAGCPKEEIHHLCRKAASDLKKILKTSKDTTELRMEMERYMSLIKNLDWHRKPSDVYRKDDAEKSAQRMVKEFDRYVTDLQSNKDANSQDVINSIQIMEKLIDNSQAM